MESTPGAPDWVKLYRTEPETRRVPGRRPSSLELTAYKQLCQDRALLLIFERLLGDKGMQKRDVQPLITNQSKRTVADKAKKLRQSLEEKAPAPEEIVAGDTLNLRDRADTSPSMQVHILCPELAKVDSISKIVLPKGRALDCSGWPADKPLPEIVQE